MHVEELRTRKMQCQRNSPTRERERGREKQRGKKGKRKREREREIEYKRFLAKRNNTITDIGIDIIEKKILSSRSVQTTTSSRANEL